MACSNVQNAMNKLTFNSFADIDTATAAGHVAMICTLSCANGRRICTSPMRGDSGITCSEAVPATVAARANGKLGEYQTLIRYAQGMAGQEAMCEAKEATAHTPLHHLTILCIRKSLDISLRWLIG